MNATYRIPVKSHRIGVCVLLFLACCFLVMPLMILLFPELDISIGYVVSSVIMIGSSLFFLRLFLWNQYGYEVFNITNGQLEHYYDYKFFRDNYSSYEIEGKYTIEFSPTSNDYGIVIFNLNNQRIESQLQVSGTDFNKIFKSPSQGRAGRDPNR